MSPARPDPAAATGAKDTAAGTAAGRLARWLRNGLLRVHLGPDRVQCQWQPGGWPRPAAARTWQQPVTGPAPAGPPSSHRPPAPGLQSDRLLHALQQALQTAPQPLAGAWVDLTLDERLLSLGVLQGPLAWQAAPWRCRPTAWPWPACCRPTAATCWPPRWTARCCRPCRPC